MQAKIYSNNSLSDGVRAYYSEKAAPFVIIYPHGHGAQSYDILKIKPRLLTKTVNELYAFARKQHSSGNIDLYNEIYKVLNCVRAAINACYPLSSDYGKILLKFISENPSIFIFQKNINRNDLYHYLIVQAGLSPNVFVDHWGEVDHDKTDHSTVIGQCRFFFPTDMRESRKKEYVNIIETCRDIFKKKGLGNVVSGNVTFGKIKEKAFAFYRITTKEIQIDVNKKTISNLMILYILIHEFSHKLMYEYMTPQKVKMIGDKYNELRRNIGKHSPDNTKVEIGTLITYGGSKKQYKGDWTVIENTPNVKIRSMDNPHVVLTAPAIDTFVVYGFKIMHPNATSMVNRASITYNHADGPFDNSSAWFPTTYSETNASEWFAECMTMYLTGKLHGEIESFFHDILK